jgi:hypothetical protein
LDEQDGCQDTLLWANPKSAEVSIGCRVGDEAEGI